MKIVGTITRFYAGRCRQYDLENLVGGCKPLIDAMKEFRIIHDDNPDVWVGYYRQEKSKTNTNYATIVLECV
jgi:hypothetical protein